MSLENEIEKTPKFIFSHLIVDKKDLTLIYRTTGIKIYEIKETKYPLFIRVLVNIANSIIYTDLWELQDFIEQFGEIYNKIGIQDTKDIVWNRVKKYFKPAVKSRPLTLCDDCEDINESQEAYDCGDFVTLEEVKKDLKKEVSKQ